MKIEAGIPTSSLPDIIFMLLIFFMVVTVLREFQGLKLILPEAKKIAKENGLPVIEGSEGGVRDIKEAKEVDLALLELSKEVSESIEQMGRSARTITVKLRWSDFTTITRQKTVPGEIHKADDIYKVARSLLYDNWEPGRPIRLLGVSASRLGVSDQQKLNLEFE